MNTREGAGDKTEPRIIYIKTSPNQRIIHCHNNSNEMIENDKGKQDGKRLSYDCVIHDIESVVMKDLSGNEYKMWRYLSKNKDGYVSALSPVDVCNYTGLSDKVYRSAVNSLISKGYLKRRDEQKNAFDFYMLPVREDDAPVSEVATACNSYTNNTFSVNPCVQKVSFNPSPEGREIIHKNTIHNTKNNIYNSTVNNTYDIQYNDDDDELPF